MNTDQFSNALNEIGDRYIEEAAAYTAKKRRVPFAKWSAIAACFVILLITAVTVLPTLLSEEKYYDYGIYEGSFASYVKGEIVDAARVGSKIEDVYVTAGWKNEAGEWLSQESLRAEVYALTDTAQNVAVALRFVDQGEKISTTDYYLIRHPNAEYNGMSFPDYKTENPVRYLEESSMGKCNGWQDFGTQGEIRTITTPIGSTYVYQMYAYYIRNDLRHIYPNTPLPEDLNELPIWLADTEAGGRKSFWYSMGLRIPEQITVTATSVLTAENGEMTFLQAEYKVQISQDRVEDWVVYFLEEDGIYSAFAVIANENFEFVKSYTESIVKSYQKKQ